MLPCELDECHHPEGVVATGLRVVIKPMPCWPKRLRFESGDAEEGPVYPYMVRTQSQPGSKHSYRYYPVRSYDQALDRALHFHRTH